MRHRADHAGPRRGHGGQGRQGRPEDLRPGPRHQRVEAPAGTEGHRWRGHRHAVGIPRTDGDCRDAGRRGRWLRSGGRHHPAGPLGRAEDPAQHRHAVHAAGKRLLPPRRDGRAADGAAGAVRRTGTPAGRLPARPARGEVQFRRSQPALRQRRGVRPQGLERSALAHRAFGAAQRRAVPQPRHRPVRDVHRHQPRQPLHSHQCVRHQGAWPARLHRGQERWHHPPQHQGQIQAG